MAVPRLPFRRLLPGVLAAIAWLPLPARAAQPALPSPPVTLQAQLNEMVGQLMAGAATDPSGRALAGPIRYEGVAWETGEGVSAGTSRLGLSLDHALEAALARRRLTTTTGPGIGSKGIGSTILKGGFQVLKSGVQLSLLLVDASSGQVISKTQRIMSSRSLMDVAQEEMLPPDAQNARLLTRLVTQSLGGVSATGGLRVGTDRGAQAAYAEGETLRVLLQSDRDCYVRLYHISWSDRALTLVFPNRNDMDSYLPAGTLKSIPAEGTGVVFEVSKPYGVDALIAISSAGPFEDEAQVTAGLGGAGFPSFAGAAKGVTRVGDYLARQGVSEEQAKGVLAKGLLVRLPDAGATPASSPLPASLPDQAAPMPAPVEPPPNEVPTTSPSNANPEPPYPPSAVTVPPPIAMPPVSPGASGRSPIERAVCYYTTLPRLRVRR